MSTCHSPCFLPPTRLSRPFFCSLPITNFTPPKDKSPIASTISSIVALGFSIKKFSTFSSEEYKFFWIVELFFWIVSESFWIVPLPFKSFFWVVVSLFWIVFESFWIVLLSFKGFFWVEDSLFWIVFESFWIVLLSFKGFFWVEDSLFWVGL